eukprot:TRINITY_DN22244_c0_g1_i1.p1 TRINITY_DN22244_c0_g1~~TRINITY_DN22244_c0_g1_i1.p1  ORF type:complete len:114 (-),score=16.46 TRINITY_DN22244_c0_g1_i1:80-421(-)
MSRRDPQQTGQRRSAQQHISEIPRLGMTTQQEGDKTNDTGTPLVSNGDNVTMDNPGIQGESGVDADDRFPPPPVDVQSPNGAGHELQVQSAPVEGDPVTLEEGHENHDCRSST